MKDKAINIVLVALIIICSIALLNKCEENANDARIKTDYSVYYKHIDSLQHSNDSLKVLANKQEQIRETIVTRYKVLRDSVKLPCDTLLQLVIASCDTIIVADSSQIANLKHIISNDSLIINDKDSIILSDSLQIVNLKKEVKKQKRHKRLAAALAVIGFGVAAIK